jgi:hypothetical protein
MEMPWMGMFIKFRFTCPDGRCQGERKDLKGFSWRALRAHLHCAQAHVLRFKKLDGDREHK